jgi:hypothetical protein
MTSLILSGSYTGGTMASGWKVSVYYARTTSGTWEPRYYHETPTGNQHECRAEFVDANRKNWTWTAGR